MRSVAALPDPVGLVLEEFDRPNGLHLTKRTVPIGVIAVIYEARPNVTAVSYTHLQTTRNPAQPGGIFKRFF